MEREIITPEPQAFKRFWVDPQAINWRIDYKSANGAAQTISVNQEANLEGFVHLKLLVSGTELQIRAQIEHIRAELATILDEI